MELLLLPIGAFQVLSITYSWISRANWGLDLLILKLAPLQISHTKKYFISKFSQPLPHHQYLKHYADIK